MSSASGDSAIKIALTSDFDGIAPWLQVTTSSPGFISRGEFGPIGVERIRKVLDEFGIKGTFFTPGHTALAYPESVRSLVADGHEIGHHGWVHEVLSPLTEGEERSSLKEGLKHSSLWPEPRPPDSVPLASTSTTGRPDPRSGGSRRVRAPRQQERRTDHRSGLR